MRPLARVLAAQVSILLITFAAPVRAGTDLDLLSTSVPPNVMIVFDTSGSMQHTVWHPNFLTDEVDPDGPGPLEPLKANQVFWPTACGGVPVDTGLAGSSCPGSTFMLPDPSDVPGHVAGDLSDDPCPLNETPNSYSQGRVLGTCPGGAPLNLSDELIDYNSFGNTWYAWNYLNWWYARVAAGTYSAADFPTDTRLATFKTVIGGLVDDIDPDVVDDPNDTSPTYTERVRFGLARYGSSGGGYVVEGIREGNKAALQTTLSGLNSNNSTPLSEVLVDVGRYFAGEHLLTDGTTSYARYDRRTDGTTTFDYSQVPQSPVDADCRKNFAIMVTDGNPTNDLHDAAYQAPFSTLIANYDLDGNECDPETGPQPQTCIDDPAIGRDDGFIYSNTGSDYLDDVAAYLFDYDLNPDMDDTQNLITYTVGFFVDNALLRESALNGGGHYFTTANASDLKTSLESALLDIIDRASTFTSATVPSSRTSFGDGFYRAYFEPSGSDALWAGHLEAYRLTSDGEVMDAQSPPQLAIDPGTNLFLDSAVPFWDAADWLADPNNARTLYTTRGGTRIPFTTADIDASDMGLTAGDVPGFPNYPAFLSDPNVNDPNDLADAVVSYLAGVDSFDNDGDGDFTELRPRVLGDIFHSNPMVVGPPATFDRTEEGYGTSSTADDPFLEQYALRDRVIYAGANDGMLHAFDAGEFIGGDDPNTTEVEDGYYTLGTGAELFGYVPGLLLDDVPNVPLNHDHGYYFVDGSPIVADAWLGDPNDPNDVTKTPDEWASVLVVGFREGGPGYLALDVTDPDATASDPHGPYPRLLWEFSHPRLAESWSEPIIARVKVRAPVGTGDQCGPSDGDGDCREEWVAIFGAGYSEAGNPNSSSFSASSLPGKGMFIVELDTGNVLASALYDPNASTAVNAMQYAVSATPAVLDLDFDGFTDVIYFGDLGGQLWKWDVSQVGEDGADADTLVDNWDVGIFFDSGSEPLAIGGRHYRSFFYPPAASFVGDDLVLAFGTGERTDLFYPGIAGEDDNNRFYVVRDDNPTGPSAFPGALTESDLAASDITGADDDSDPTDEGFFFKLADSEKFVTNQLVFAGYVITTTYTPSPPSADVCDRTGVSKLYIFDVYSGRGFYFESGVTTGDAARSVSIGAGAPTDPRLSLSIQGEDLFIQTTSGEVVVIDPPDPGSLVRTIYWRRRF